MGTGPLALTQLLSTFHETLLEVRNVRALEYLTDTRPREPSGCRGSHAASGDTVTHIALEMQTFAGTACDWDGRFARFSAVAAVKRTDLAETRPIFVARFT